ncbi:MAG TPA: hypothetical protein VFQ74_06775, partial [Pseudolysinimonas sp.]|nr:hypothetical protein [Pseudolysinimonas sp.]
MSANDDQMLDRVLASEGAKASGVSRFGADGALGRAQALQAEGLDEGVDEFGIGPDVDGEQFDRDARASLRRVGGLSTELEDVTEVEYRQLRLENVVLIGVYSGQGLEDAENSLRELAALAETAGAVVLDGLLQRRPHPDPATYLGRG